jgi:hypothetical protein
MNSDYAIHCFHLVVPSRVLTPKKSDIFSAQVAVCVVIPFGHNLVTWPPILTGAVELQPELAVHVSGGLAHPPEGALV